MKKLYPQNRRKFIKTLSLGAASLAIYSPWQSVFAIARDRTLSFYHTHTSEKLNITYFSEGSYLTKELNNISHFLRDFRTGDVHPIDKNLLDMLYAIRYQTGSEGIIEVISGYRSPKTNSALRANSSGVAKKSLHMLGKAIDIRFSDIDTLDVKKSAFKLKAGGVGYYEKSDFVHLDTGRFRTW